MVKESEKRVQLSFGQVEVSYGFQEWIDGFGGEIISKESRIICLFTMK